MNTFSIFDLNIGTCENSPLESTSQVWKPPYRSKQGNSFLNTVSQHKVQTSYTVSGQQIDKTADMFRHFWGIRGEDFGVYVEVFLEVVKGTYNP